MVGYLPTYLFFIIYASLWTNTCGVVKIKVIVSFQEIFSLDKYLWCGKNKGNSIISRNIYFHLHFKLVLIFIIIII